jgi:hypothetical protein
MLLLGRISFFLLLVVFILMVIEYALLRNMALFYYKNGPFATKTTFKSINKKSAIINHLLAGRDRGEFFIRQLNNSILLSYKPTVMLWFSKGRFPTQRIVLTFPDGTSGPEVYCEVRPFYSAFLLPIFICLVFIFDVVLPNQYAGVPMKIFGVIVACLISLAIFLPFRPSSDTINNVKNDLTSTQISSKGEGSP